MDFPGVGLGLIIFTSAISLRSALYHGAAKMAKAFEIREDRRSA